MKIVCLFAFGISGYCGLAMAQGPRPWLHQLSRSEQGELSSLILSFLTDEEIHWHMNIDHENSESFFLGHRAYIRRLEDYLQQKGAGRFVPLPKWDPARPVPPTFTLVRFDYEQLQDTTGGLPVPLAFRGESLKQFNSIDDLYQSLRPYHDEVHRQVGGSMADVMTAPGAPIFFCWHAMLDDIFGEWAFLTGYQTPNGPDGIQFPGGRPQTGHDCICGPSCRCGSGCQCPRRRPVPNPPSQLPAGNCPESGPRQGNCSSQDR